ncbi:hypothetical protein [Sphingobacterium paucimobilis]|uniref:Uncharacterized protein n=1 Tax=Sphingobacterium paucimobilis HER1398 TaxID=1346330 RepID=U2HXP5_9SPHI|nr:hypothetical protein [Sphingobacterium paucimobilis]ERJ57876.1 hypothetical protein M472_03760 [Sphingobacterium paucimobilis HER1398]ERJ60327.1 hypothetical protein M472_16330 [Sphingobacterium paucimobilis HER1398]
MKNLNILLITLVFSLFVTSCEKHVVEYDTVKVDEETTAQFQLFYMVPVTTGTANNINKVELNNELLTNETTPLSAYNFIPSGAVGKFFVAKPGKVNLKLHRGAITNLTLAYDQDFELPAGKYVVVIHDFTKPPVFIKNETPYPSVTTEFTGSTAWVKFSNFLYEKAGEPTTLKLQYQFQYTVDNATGQKSDWANVGKPVAFGEATGWEPLPVNKTVEISAGTARIDYRIRLIGADGSDQGSLKVRNAAGNTVDYSDWWNATIGRINHHMLAGYRAATPVASMKQLGVL